MTSETARRNLLVFTTLSSVWAVIFGLIGPFYVVQVERLSGGMEKLGIAFGIMVLVQSGTAYCAGHYSDSLGRKPFLFLTAYAGALILFLYTVIHETYQLYLLQGLLGVTQGVADTITTSFLGDLTKKERRGRAIGSFNAIVGLGSAAGLSIGGYVAKLYGLQSLFYFAATAVVLSTVFLFFIHEDKK